MKEFVRGSLVSLAVLASFSESIAHADSILYATDALSLLGYSSHRRAS
jgi:hypothetical protein